MEHFLDFFVLISNLNLLKLKLQYFGHLMWRADSLEKTLMLGGIGGRRRRGRQRMRWLDGITDSDGREFEWTPGVGDGQGGLVCCSPWGHKESDITGDWTELNWSSKKHTVWFQSFEIYSDLYYGPTCGLSWKIFYVSFKRCVFCSWWVKSESESEVAQSCPTLCDPMDCSQPGSSVHEILQARILEWVAVDGYNSLNIN